MKRALASALGRQTAGGRARTLLLDEHITTETKAPIGTLNVGKKAAAAESQAREHGDWRAGRSGW